ncbi:hypothetical protein CU097_004884, partial [Rhizopus azygosporus]
NNNTSASSSAASRPNKRIRLNKSSTYKCACGVRVETLQELVEHRAVYTASSNTVNEVEMNDLETQVNAMEIDNDVSSKNTEENHKSYKSSYQTDPAYGKAHLYQSKTIDENIIKLVENLSISLNNIMNSYGAFRELHKEVCTNLRVAIRRSDRLQQLKTPQMEVSAI